MLTIESGKAPNKRCKLRELECVMCGAQFAKHIAPSEIKAGRGTVCSKFCKNVLVSLQLRSSLERTCVTCGNVFLCKPSDDRSGAVRTHCSRACIYPNKKLSLPVGKYKSYDGYVVINRTPDGRKQIKEHRYLFEQAIGRRLLPTEVVHHINHDKLDNRLENLQLLSRSEHNKLHKLLERE
jgi:hypothetical protein